MCFNCSTEEVLYCPNTEKAGCCAGQCADYLNYKPPSARDSWCWATCTVKSNQNFRDITLNVEENLILHEIFREESRFPSYILYYIAESRFPLGQFETRSTVNSIL